jgi:YHS domain-containing protein
MLTRTIAVLCLFSGLATIGAAQAKMKPAAGPTCPVCHMALSTKKTKVNTVAVKIKGKTYYCCAGCKMPAHKK